ncbi:hypothetical protein KI809_18540 [Geobacter pelophilus]|uniref:Uncharacterized protein n=1 Tax=Geoanaerobacter pelophilus TaxID=60036 RepID=A0AAW4L697_9BACT|nr:hypothetical protein [Geoanaerobacter pelophilus]MBT0666314.1 hypothetical protein [Geoanaerobacter pelophilus]
MDFALKLFGVTLLALLINLPLGYLRQNCEKFTFGWYFYVHISIPVIIFLRVKAGFSWHFIPVTLGAAVAGQLIGGRINRRFKRSD